MTASETRSVPDCSSSIRVTSLSGGCSKHMARDEGKEGEKEEEARVKGMRGGKGNDVL